MLYEKRIFSGGWSNEERPLFRLLHGGADCPDVETTVSGKYIINGYYTDFEASTESLSPRMNSDHYLVLGNQVTDYKISSSDILTQTGGMVETLSVSALIFLLMLCLTAAPLMSIFRGIIPWFKKQLKSIQKQLSRT